MRSRISAVLTILVSSCLWTIAADAQPRAIDIANSVLIVRVYKAGLLSALGHNHEIAAPIAGGTVSLTDRQVELHINARALTVRDPETSDKDRAEIQRTMLGPDVLDAERYPKITFRSTGAESPGSGSWKLHGALSLHGQTRTVEMELHEENGHYVGSSRFKQTEFGIQPVKVAGGTVRVKDEVRIEFNIQLAR